MRRTLVALLAAGVLVAGAAADVPAAAAPSTVGFDDLDNGQYLAPGENYRGLIVGGGGVQVAESGLARSAPNVATCGKPPGTEFCGRGALIARFERPQHRVRVWVGYLSASSSSFTVTLRAFDANGRQIASDAAGFLARRFPYPASTPLEVVVPGNPIASFDVDSSGADDNVITDDVEFERAEPALDIVPDPADFGDVDPGASRALDVIVRSTGTATLAIRRVTVAPAAYALVGDGCTGESLPPGQQCAATVRFAPPGTGTFGGTLTVTANTPEGQHTGALTGRGVSRAGSTTTTGVRDLGTPPDTITTVPPVVPSATPGAALTLDPPIGPGGFVTRARGAGFPPNAPVTLGWEPGIGVYQATTSGDGAFQFDVLVMHRDVAGPRTLVATSGATSAAAAFLVVPATVEPSGGDVAVRSRRRFVSR